MNKTALITGASRGIGRACAEELCRRGFSVAINYIHSHQPAQTLADSLNAAGGRAAAFCADVADEGAVNEMVQAVREQLGKISLLVNNAGIAGQKLFCDITPKEWRRMFDVTVTGSYHCCRAVLPRMIREKEGRIINISSVWGLVGASCEVHYSAAKAALIGLTRALAKEVGPSGICVNCIAPGVIQTDMCQALPAKALAALAEETPLGRLGTPQDVARAVAFLAGEGGDFITGQVLSPNGGFVI